MTSTIKAPAIKNAFIMFSVLVKERVGVGSQNSDLHIDKGTINHRGEGIIPTILKSTACEVL